MTDKLLLPPCFEETKSRDTQKSMCITVVTDTSILIAICYVNTRLASPSFPKENL